MDKENDKFTEFSIQEIAGEKWLFHHEFPRFYARVIDLYGNKPLTDLSWCDECDEFTADTAARRTGEFIFNYRKNG